MIIKYIAEVYRAFTQLLQPYRAKAGIRRGINNSWAFDYIYTFETFIFNKFYLINKNTSRLISSKGGIENADNVILGCICNYTVKHLENI